MEERRLKLVVVGDGAVGKTCMLISYSRNEFPTAYVPTIFEHYAYDVMVEGEVFTVTLFDTAGQEDYDRLRRLVYPNTDLFLVCFSVVSPTSFENVREKWIPELKRYYPGAPCLLVGTQTDLRSDEATLNRLAKERQPPVTMAQGVAMAGSLGAAAYVECSARTKKNLKKVFDQAVILAITSRTKTSPMSSCHCTLL